MDKLRKSKLAHVLVAIFITLVAGLSIWFFPSLWRGESAKFGTLTGFFTIYGVIFAIIEVIRTKSAAEEAKDSTQKVLDHVEKLSGIRLLSECQTAIDLTVKCIDDGQTIPLSHLLKILKIYSQHYHEELQIATSEQRQNVGILESYAGARPHRGGVTLTASGNLKTALVAMTRGINTDVGRSGKIGGVK